jgi:hypothetical protein
MKVFGFCGRVAPIKFLNFNSSGNLKYAAKIFGKEISPVINIVFHYGRGYK